MDETVVVASQVATVVVSGLKVVRRKVFRVPLCSKLLPWRGLVDGTLRPEEAELLIALGLRPASRPGL